MNPTTIDPANVMVEKFIFYFFTSPPGIILIIVLILDIAMIIAFFVMAYNIGKIRVDIREWFDMEHPYELVDDPHPTGKDSKNT